MGNGDSSSRSADVIAALWAEREAAAPTRPAPVAPRGGPARGGPAGERTPRPPREQRPPNYLAIVGVLNVVVLVAGVAAAAVGDFGPRPSRAAYVASADAVCTPPSAAPAALRSYPELAAAAETVTGAIDGQAASLGKLRRPAGADGKAADAVVAGLRGAAALGRNLALAATQSDVAGVVSGTAAFAGQFNATSVQAKALGLTACGASLKPGVDAVFGGAHTVVKGSYVAKAEALCQAAAPAINGLPLPRSGDPADLLRYLDQALGLNGKLMADLKAVPVPPGDEATVKDMMAVLDAVEVQVREARAAAGRGDAPGFVGAFDAIDQLGVEADARLDAYGLVSCGSGFSEL